MLGINSTTFGLHDGQAGKMPSQIRSRVLRGKATPLEFWDVALEREQSKRVLVGHGYSSQLAVSQGAESMDRDFGSSPPPPRPGTQARIRRNEGLRGTGRGRQGGERCGVDGENIAKNRYGSWRT